MALAIDSQEASATAHHSTSSPLTWSFNNVAGTLLVIVAHVTDQGGSACALGTPTYAGVSMTQAPSSSVTWNSADILAIYYLLNPATGSNTVSIMALYLLQNGAAGTTAAPVAVTTGNTIKTMLQFKPSATVIAKIVEWGISFDGTTAATPGKIELMESDVAATVTAHAAADITKYDSDALMGGDPTTNLIQVGTTATGYTSSGEGTTTVSRVFDLQYIAPTGQYVKQFPLGPRADPAGFEVRSHSCDLRDCGECLLLHDRQSSSAPKTCSRSLIGTRSRRITGCAAEHRASSTWFSRRVSR
jgi:hypothetical protein